MIGFVLLHSGLANCGFFKRFAGPLHRCLYNIISCAYILVRRTICLSVCLLFCLFGCVKQRVEKVESLYNAC